MDSAGAISDFVGNWIQEGGEPIPVSCHAISNTKLKCTIVLEYRTITPEFSLVGGNLTVASEPKVQGNLGTDGKIVTWYEAGVFSHIWKKIGTMSIINHKNSKNHFF